MKVKGSTITGFLQFVPGLTYTKDDFILYKNRVYIVTGPSYDGKVSPEKSKDCTDYVAYNSFKVGSDSDNAIVTSKSIFGIVKKYFKGLTGNGEIETIEVESVTTLDKYNETGAYNCLVRKEFLAMLPVGYYLLRIYKTKGDTVLQEFISYETGLVVIRNLKNSGMFVLPGSIKENQERIYLNLLNINQRIKDIVQTNKKLREKSFNYLNVPVLKTGERKYLVREAEEDNIVHLIFFDRSETETIQHSKEVYVTSLTKGLKIHLTDLDYFTTTFENSDLTVEVSRSNIELAKVYVSRGNK